MIVAIKKRGYVGWQRIADCGRSHRAIGVPPGNLGSDRQRCPMSGPALRAGGRAKVRVIYEGGPGEVGIIFKTPGLYVGP